jgi:hypothetical protein
MSPAEHVAPTIDCFLESTMQSLVRLFAVYGLLPVLAISCARDVFAAEFPGLGPKGNLVSIAFETGSQPVLQGRNSRKQLVVTGTYSSGQKHDLTHDVAYSVDQPNVIKAEPTGLLTPLSDGAATVTARSPDGKTATIALKAERCTEELPVNFANEIVPIFTKLGCNSGGCHGKSDGQNGFKLSLLGFYPEEDYEYLVHENRGRRVFPADADYSLLLLKPANMLPHGGGKRMAPGTYEWQLISNWIAQGSPAGSSDDATLDRIEVIPAVREMNIATKQQLSVVAYYSDGSTRDVTQLASYEANQPEMVFTEPSGRITVEDTPGEAAVMVRFQSQVAVFRAIIPQGLPVPSLPPQKTFVDQFVFARLKQLGIPPSPLCDDATFIRRVTIDITGQLPDAEQTRAFIADTKANKRDALVDRLVASPGYADYFANKWASVLRNKRRNGNDVKFTYRFHAWIRQQLEQNTPYDVFVREILTASGDAESHPPVAWYRELGTSTAQMEDTAQLFLGMRLACAKCHHHPFERWSQQDYYGFEAFFTQVGLKVGRYNPETNRPDIVYLKGNVPQSQNPRTQQNVKPTGLGGEPLDIPAWEDARHSLVDWMAANDNPFFAKALVNRYWKHFFGRGIVDPEDDLRVTNPPSNPELLAALEKHFKDSRYDMKDLVRSICKSSVYQLSSEPTEFNASDSQNFSSFYPRRMPAEILYDAINHVAGVPATFGGVPRGMRAVQLPDNGFNNYFLQVFGKPEAESACECERSAEANLAQSLHLLNSTDVQGRLQSGTGRGAGFARDTERAEEDKVTDLYLWAFSRNPTAEESKFVVEHLSTATNKQQAWEDVIWAMLNAKEFQFVR